MQLAGELAKINLPSLIQMVRNGELTGKICLTQGVTTAFIYVDRGRIFHVETDITDGREALLDLFLWTVGTFSFVDYAIDNIAPSLAADEPIDKLVREGIAYADSKKFLDQLRIGPTSILKCGRKGSSADEPLMALLDGQTTLQEVSKRTKLTRCDLTLALKRLVSSGEASVVEPPGTADQIKLPEWVISRLKQDNSDPAKAIIDMVIWVDRVKCWMYQTDADLNQVINALVAAHSHQQGVDVEEPASFS